MLNSATSKDSTSGTNKDKEREFATTTVVFQYFLNKKTTLTANYEIRSINAPNAPTSAPPVHDIVDSIDNRLSLQLRIVY